MTDNSDSERKATEVSYLRLHEGGEAVIRNKILEIELMEKENCDRRILELASCVSLIVPKELLLTIASLWRSLIVIGENNPERRRKCTP